MSNFHVGQRVVCISNRPRAGRPPLPLIKRQVYIVRAVAGHQDTDGDRGIYLHGIHNDWLERLGCERPFKSWRFRPVAERKTDISIFTKLLIPSPCKETA